MVFEGFLRFGGVEVVNSERVRGYSQTVECPSNWIQGPECPGLREALGDELYTHQNIPLAPWYDFSLPDVSSRFLGVYGLEIEGTDRSTREAGVTQGILDGGVIGRTRKAARAVRVRATLIAQGGDALDYGVSWLNSALTANRCGQHGDSCGTTDVEYFTDCPPERGVVADFSPWEERARNLATNPSFEAGSGTVEVRRNWGKAISAEATTARFANFSATTMSITPDPKGAGVDVVKMVTTGTSGGITQNVVTGANMGSAENMPAGVATFTARVLGTAGQIIRMGVQEYSPSITLRGENFENFTATGEWQEITMSRTLVAADSRTRIAVQLPVTGEAYVWAMTSETGVTPGGIILPGFPSPDSDLTPGWVSTVGYGESILTGVSPAGIEGGTSSTASMASILSTQHAESGSRSLRTIPLGSTNATFYQHSGYNLSFFQVGKTYTIMATVTVATPQTGTIHAQARSIVPLTSANGGGINIVSAPNVVGTHRLRTTFTVPTAATWAVVRLFNGASVGNGDLWWDDFAVIEGEYEGPWFDGDSADTELERYAWLGTENASVSTFETRTEVERPQTDEEYEAVIAPLRRILHDVGVTSGPLPIEQLKSNAPGDFRGVTMEWTITSERAWIYSPTRPVDLPTTPSFVVEDTPYNLAPYPSAELSAGAMVAATNYSTNPSVESNATGWESIQGGLITSAMVTSGRAVGELFAVGNAAFRAVFTATAASAGNPSTFFGIQQTVPIGARPAGSRMSISFWAAELLMAGTAARGPIRFAVDWMPAVGSAPLRTDDLGTAPVEGGSVSVKSLLPPTGAGSARVRVEAPVTNWSSGTVIRLYADALSVTVP